MFSCHFRVLIIYNLFRERLLAEFNLQMQQNSD